VASRRVRRSVSVAAGLVLIGTAVSAGVMIRRQAASPDIATATVTRGEFVDTLEIRGEVRPVRSVVVTAPMQAGDLQILKIVANGSMVKAGDTVVEFDATTLQHTVQDKLSELNQAEEGLKQAKSAASITTNQDQTNVAHTTYDVSRAKLGVVDEDFIAKVDSQKARLALADAEQKQREAEVKGTSNQQASETGFTAQESKIAKIKMDLAVAQRALAALAMKAPTDGLVSIMTNWQTSSMGTQQEFRAGDHVWAGAQILELPDLSAVHLAARLEEYDRGRLQLGQTATIRLDAVPDHDYQASVTSLSVLARVDFSSWPPQKNFDTSLTFADADSRLRPGMNGVARVAVGRMPNMLLVPAESVFLVDGRAVVYRLERRALVAVPVEVAKRNKEQAAIVKGLKEGDRIALTKPPTEAGGASQ
jgi:multidrug efflux pump subunit AcrA (membrane-fusion protein)